MIPTTFQNNRSTTKTFAAAVFMFCALMSAAQANESALVPPGEEVDGISQSAWSQRWWEWAFSFPMELSPVADQTGELCAGNQSGNVWFLAGTYGTKRAIRTCHVPRGKHVFFPLINYVAFPSVSGQGQCMEYMSLAAKMTQNPSALVLSVDGVRVDGMTAHRQWSPSCFDLGAKAMPSRSIYPAAANGYYAMLRPLSPGRHTVEFGGALPSLYQAVTYTLIVD